ncbi:hypothetical protein SLEP1_g38630 [Rubroshorea leprosula]|nr:hypothetical protein SLEP1_g38630 [Rubroshorea leprosula]
MNHESGMDDNGRTRSVSLPRVVNIERTHSVSLLKAIQRGDVDAVRHSFYQHRHAKNGRVLEIGCTALHVATISGQERLWRI